MALLLMLVGASMLIAPALLAQTGAQFDLTWWTADGGGGTSADGPYSLTGTIGQPDSGALSDNRFTLLGGFWPGRSSDATPTTTPTATITATPSLSPTETASATATGRPTIQPTVATSTATASTTAPTTATAEATPTTTSATETAQIAEYHIYLPYAVRGPL